MARILGCIPAPQEKKRPCLCCSNFPGSVEQNLPEVALVQGPQSATPSTAHFSQVRPPKGPEGVLPITVTHLTQLDLLCTLNADLLLTGIMSLVSTATFTLNRKLTLGECHWDFNDFCETEVKLFLFVCFF